MKSERTNWCWAIFASILVVSFVGIERFTFAESRRGDPKPVVTVVEAPGDYTDVSWSAQPVPVDAVAVPSPLRTEIAADIFAGLLSDPSWRVQYDDLFRWYLSSNIKREVAARMADAMAAERAVSLADALIRAAGE